MLGCVCNNSGEVVHNDKVHVLPLSSGHLCQILNVLKSQIPLSVRLRFEIVNFFTKPDILFMLCSMYNMH